MLRRTLIAAAAALTAFAAQAQNIVLKATDTHPAGYPTVVAVENMGKKLEAATNGRIKMQMFPGAVLGQEKEVVEQTQLGAIQIARISLGVIGPVVPDVDVFKFSAKAGQNIAVEVIGGKHGSCIEPLLTLYNDKNHLIKSNAASDLSSFSAAIPADGTYFLVLNDANDRGGNTHPYQLRLLLK